jgi:hypothetical protein
MWWCQVFFTTRLYMWLKCVFNQKYNLEVETDLTVWFNYHLRMPKYRLYSTSQVKSIFNFFNVKRKLLSCNADIKFNQMCLAYGIPLNYAVVKCTGNLIPCIRTKCKVEIIRVKNEIKFLTRSVSKG